MSFQDPASYISVISSSLLIISELLPFLPCKPNGLIDIIFKLDKYTIENNCRNYDKELIRHLIEHTK